MIQPVVKNKELKQKLMQILQQHVRELPPEQREEMLFGAMLLLTDPRTDYGQLEDGVKMLKGASTPGFEHAEQALQFFKQYLDKAGPIVDGWLEDT